ncbi:MAG: VanW family protein [Pyrinomonadaceae bacterium]
MPEVSQTTHTRIQSLIFKTKAALLQTKRGMKNIFDKNLKKFPKAAGSGKSATIAESKTPLWTESQAEEQFLLAGKVHNLRLAIKKLDGVEIPAGEIFSFWKHIGQANRARGFVQGRELREGCIIPNVGGGLCQLSNALYDAALKANFEIVERHAHTQIVAGSLAEQGRDATIFWNYVDLRFRSPVAFRIETFLGKDHLTVKFKGENGNTKLFRISPRTAVKIQNSRFKIQDSRFKIQDSELKIQSPKTENQQPNSCATCGVESCFRSLKPEAHLDFGRTAFLLDEFSPEFDEYIQQAKNGKDFLFVPLDGKRFRKANYAWNMNGFARKRQSFMTTFIRSYKSRKLSAQGAQRQKSLLEMSEKLAEIFAKRLSYDVLHVVVSQNLLPFLWKNGHLGGRTFDVLMNALPVRELQERLDFAASIHKKSKTLGDFRAEEWLVEAETEALQMARKIITPHTEIASLFTDKCEIVNWSLPETKNLERKINDKFTIVFPASTVGRKGSYELRDAVRDLNVKLITLGAIIEDADFWRGIDWEKGADDWLGKADLVVLPAFVEHKPRRLLQAVAQKIPVIASTACGLETVENVTNIEISSVKRLREEIISAIEKAVK